MKNTVLIAALVAFAASPSFGQVFEPLDTGSTAPEAQSSSKLNSITIQADSFKWNLPSVSYPNVGGGTTTNTYSTSAETNMLIAGDFAQPLGSKSKAGYLMYGGWFSPDSQKLTDNVSATFAPSTGLSPFSIDLNATQDNFFIEEHVGYGMAVNGSASFGATVGYLSARLKSTYPLFNFSDGSGSYAQTDVLNEHWFGVNLVGSITPISKLTIGATLGHVMGKEGDYSSTVTITPTDGSPSTSTIAETTDSSNGTTYGLSVAFEVTPTITVNAAYWKMSLDDSTSMDRSSAGIGFRF
ncbi:MAG: hypothetical protein ACLQVD_14045 [Capsulimonadaceae bacterium]